MAEVPYLLQAVLAAMVTTCRMKQQNPFVLAKLQHKCITKIHIYTETLYFALKKGLQFRTYLGKPRSRRLCVWKPKGG